MEVSEVMHSPVVTISPGELLSEAAKQMIDNRIGGLPVLDTNDQMVGILTETDLLRALIDQFRQGNSPGILGFTPSAQVAQIDLLVLKTAW